MKTDKLTIDQLDQMSVKDALELPLEQIEGLLVEIADADKRVKRAKAWTADYLSQRVGERATALRKADGKDFGTVRVEDGEFEIVCESGKKVEWDQKKLATAILELQKSGEKSRDYVDTVYKVTENKYKAWPERIRKIFDPARITKPEAPKFELVRKRVDE
jgi:hypothetical protein